MPEHIHNAEAAATDAEAAAPDAGSAPDRPSGTRTADLPSAGRIVYRTLSAEELTPALFGSFVRTQNVTKVWRKRNGAWVIEDDPFVDDWTPADYEFLCTCLRNTVAGNGLVLGAFSDDGLKGFASVEGEALGSRSQYRDLTSLHVSQDARRHGIGRALFKAACEFAAANGGEKLYISSHSAVETQDFYRAMGCIEAEEYSAAHVEQEPFDCQLERALG